MASGTIGADESKLTHRWRDTSKVYTRRKSFKNDSVTVTAAANTNTATATATATNGDRENNASAPTRTINTTVANGEGENNATADTTTTTTATNGDGENNATAAPTSITATATATNEDGENNATAASPTATATNGDGENNATAATTTTSATATNGDGENNATAATTTTTNDNEKNNSDTVPQQDPEILATEDRNSSPQQQTVSLLDAVSDDLVGSHGKLPGVNSPRQDNGNCALKPVVTRVENRVKIDLVGNRSKNEIRELKRKLVHELGQVRNVVKKLEAKEVQLKGYSTPGGAYSHSQYSGNDGRALVRVNSEVGSVGHFDYRPFQQLRVALVDNSHGPGEFVEKEKRTPKANQYYHNSEFLLGKERLPPAESNKKSKSNGGKKHGGDLGYRFGIMDKHANQAFKSCSNLLSRLMKHKYAWVFNKPVDANELGLHDYHDIIKHPMDLGTVKTRLSKNWYKSPREFAEDVRLTFRNAMTYNPKGQDVHVMADEMLKVFEEKWAAIESEYNSEWRYDLVHDFVLPTPTSRKVHRPPFAPPLFAETRTLERAESMTGVMPVKFKPNAYVGRTPVPKKPKAKDPYKRDMTYEEKQRLSTNLQSLPSEKLDNIVQIIKKRNSALSQHDDEIEVDIDSVDTETLWELDRFVTNYKKSLSKHKRKAELALQARAATAPTVPTMNQIADVVGARKESIVDKNNEATTSPAQGEREVNNISRSSSSSSSSSDSGSSSSDSDSDSSSACGSDEAHSPKA